MTWKPLPTDCKAAEVWDEYIHDLDSTYFLLEGAVRSSKTFGSILAWAYDIKHTAPPGPLAMLGKTRETLIQNVIYPLQDLVGTESANLNRGTGTLRLFNRPIFLFGADNIRAASKLQGKGFVRAYCDEAETYPYEVWQMLGTRTGSDQYKIIATFNPGPPNHYLKKEYIDCLDDINGRHWHFTLDDNPFISEKEKTRLKRQYKGIWYKRYILGLWVMAEGAVYPNYESALISPQDIPDCDTYIVGCDYGAANPFVYLLLGKSKIDNVWYVLKEWYEENKVPHVNSQYTAQLGKFLDGIHPRFIDCDHEPAFIHQLRDEYPQLDVRYAIKDVLMGIQHVAQMLYSGRLRISRNCPKLIDEMAGYVWDSKAQEKGEDAPLKVNDHACLMGDTEILTVDGIKKISEIKPGDKVLSHDGKYHRVNLSEMTNSASEVYEVQLSNGISLFASANHPIWIESVGWCSVDALRYGYIVRTPKSIAWNQYDIKGKSTEDTQNPNAGMIESISRLMDSRGRLIIFTETFMRIIKELFQAGLKSTTKTTIRPTTLLKILSWFELVITGHITQKTYHKRGAKGIKNISKISALLLLLGILPNPVLSGIKSMALKHGRTEKPLRKSALHAENRLIASHEGQMIGSAPMRVNPHGEGDQKQMMKSAFVRCAATNSKLISIPNKELARESVAVLKVVKQNERKPVYNLEVEGTHTFFANGILTHNCDALRYATMRIKHVYG